MSTYNKEAEPTGDQLRAIVRQARNMNGPSDETSPQEYVCAGWMAAVAALTASVAPATEQAPPAATGPTCMLTGDPYAPGFPVTEFRSEQAPKCDTCNGTGLMCVGTSGNDDDGNASVLERCGECGYGEQAPAGEVPSEPPDELITAMALAYEQSPCHDLEGPMHDVYSVVIKHLVASAKPADPMDWPLPCDVTVGPGTIKQGVPLRVLVTRMKVLHSMVAKPAEQEKACRERELLAALADARWRIANLVGPNGAQGLDRAVLDKIDALMSPQQAPTTAAHCTQCSGINGHHDELCAAQGWQQITAPGQVKVGDKLRFDLCGKVKQHKVCQVLHAGTDAEEIIYHKRNNWYVITSMAISGTGSQKNVEFFAHKGAQGGKA